MGTPYKKVQTPTENAPNQSRGKKAKFGYTAPYPTGSCSIIRPVKRVIPHKITLLLYKIF